MYLNIMNSTPEVDQKIRTICDYILPTQGGRLYSILDNSNSNAQTLQMDGRTVNIQIESFGITINFGPIVR